MTTVAVHGRALERDARELGSGPAPTGLPRPIAVLLGVPLFVKLMTANLVIGAATVLAALAMYGSTLADSRVAALLIGALTVAQIANGALVILALRPIRALEDVASRVVRGDTSARVPFSPLADRNVARTGRALNQLLDDLLCERDRIRGLAAKVIRAQDEERARIARELHDATAQTMAGVVLQLSVAERSCGDDDAAVTKIREIRGMATEALEEVRTLSHTIYPSVLDDLGLPSALEWLARRTEEQDAVETRVEARGDAGRLTKPAASVLYRVAQEALSNAVRHATPRRVTLRLEIGEDAASLLVADDGRGFNVAEAKARRPGMGLFTMRERVALVDGTLTIDSAPGRGTTITAGVPLTTARDT